MAFDGERLIAAERAAVWAALRDADTLRACIPGCMAARKAGPARFDVIVKRRIGPLPATFRGTVALSEIEEGTALLYTVEVAGGFAGNGRGDARVTIAEAEGGTKLRYEGDVVISGRFAGIGASAIAGAGDRVAARFFTTLRERVEGGTGA